jgi:hypothetical protein
VSQDPSRAEAAQAGLFHELAETDESGHYHKHVTATDLAPDHLAQQANTDVAVEPVARLALVVAAVVAVAVALAVVAVAVAVNGS